MMTRRIFAFILTCPLLLQALAAQFLVMMSVASAPSDDPGKEDRARLRGTWSVTRVAENGREIKDRGMSGARLTFDDDELVWEGGEGKERHTFKLDTKSKPRAMLTTRTEPARLQSGWMLYDLKADTLKIAFNDALMVRPASFEPRKNLFILELKRAPKP